MPPLHDQEDDGEDLRATIEAAFRGEDDQSTGNDDTPTDPPPKDAEAVAGAQDDAAEKPVTADPAKKADAPKADNAEGDAKDAPKLKDEKGDIIDPPTRWTKAQKEWFAKQDKEVQRQLYEQDKHIQADYTRKMQEIGQERERYKGLEEALAPRRELWQRAGMSDAQALNSILSYWDLANRDPVQFLQVVAQERGIDLAQLYRPTPQDIARYMAEYDLDGEGAGQANAVSPQLQARLDALEQRNAQLEQYVQHFGGAVQSQQQAQMQEIEQRAHAALHEFESATDDQGQPLHPFLNEVRGNMSNLLRRGVATDLKDAYEQAVWGRPELRQKMLESMDLRRQREEEAARQQEAARARRAGASVSTASTPAAAAGPIDDVDENASLRDIIKHAWQQSTAGDRI